MSHSMEFHDLGWFLVTGGLIGLIAGISSRRNGMDIVADIAVGIIGSMFGGWLGGFLGMGGFWGAFAMAILGTVVFMSILRLFNRKANRMEDAGRQGPSSHK